MRYQMAGHMNLNLYLNIIDKIFQHGCGVFATA